MQFGANLRRIREAKGKSQRRVWIDTGGEDGGIDPSTLSKLETGVESNPTLRTLAKLARFGYGIEVAELFIDEDGNPVVLPD